VSSNLLIEKATREMSIDDENKGKTPFWISSNPGFGEEVHIGMMPEVLIGTVSSVGSAIETIQGFQLHAYIQPETGGALLDYDWDKGLLLSIVLIPVSNPSPNQVEMCYEPFYSLGFHGCNQRFKLKATNINLGPPVLDPISVASSIQLAFISIIFCIICGSLTFIHYRSQRRPKKRRRIKKKK